MRSTGILSIMFAELSASIVFAAEKGSGIGGGSPHISAQTPENAPAGIAPATDFDPAGAPVQIVPDVDPDHPAVDNDPRAGTSIAQNRIDFNDPTMSMEEAVEKNLGDQGDVTVKTGN